MVNNIVTYCLHRQVNSYAFGNSRRKIFHFSITNITKSVFGFIEENWVQIV